jgi:hypothetical protein
MANLTSGDNLDNMEVRQHDNNNSEANLGISSKTLLVFMAGVMKGFETMNAKVQAQKNKLAGKLDSKIK